MKTVALSCILLALPAAAADVSSTARLKELVSIEGVRDNQLIGYGVVVGLAGTGDKQQTVFSLQSLLNLLQRMGITVPGPTTSIQVKNTAAVMVTATLPPFAQPGTKIDATVSAIGDASNLQGGMLLMTTLHGIDGQVYSIAQGPVVTGGFIAGRGGTNQARNHPTVGRIPNGASVERPSPSLAPEKRIRLQLRDEDFMTAARISEAVNKRFAADGPAVAHADNSALVSVAVPPQFADHTTEFIAELERLQVEADRPARVVINERTGTIVMGKEVKVSPVAIMHGNLTVEIQTTYTVAQPAPLSTGTTEVVPQVGVGVKEEKARNIVLQQGATVEELVRALGSIGSTPRDVIAILQSLRSAGALEADVEVI